ncbi:MAG TPA: methylenetetrahydrofolate reductase [NAD(P)H] [Polyangiaceae bacterium]|jgi:methylenetetrahydrofolate reductase (NADPH)|nr:methylenetetrahydrofolate reductase [NAD(P)H] [Polyangiaceae bacterium]
MHIRDVFRTHRLSCSFEFFPPKSPAGAEALFETVRQLEPLKPAFVSMTYGAGGSTRDLTHDLVLRLKRETTLDPVPHLTCVCHTRAEMRQILERYAVAGVSNILALGGDPPRHLANYDRTQDELQHARDLVAFIREFDSERAASGTQAFGIGVAGFPEGHPATPNRLTELDYFKAKVDAGADFIITQLFFDNRDFYDFRERCELAGINVPIIAGIMPVSSVDGMKRMAELALGARFPARLLRDLRRCGDNRESVERVGIHWATEQCLDLIDHGVKGLHFYTLNKSTATLEIYKHLGVSDSTGLQQR